ncbi:MAG TPA: HDIG domain-containing protein, partial [Spirochaetota bacterium]|nr:HDIG domain-containing protein [Spirochaetota bacterium]
EDINDKNKIYEKIKKDIDKKFTDYNTAEKELIFSVMKIAVNDNLVLSEDITQTRLNNKLKNSTIVFRKIKQGQVLIRKGDIVTKEDILKIEALNSNKENKIGIKYIFFVLFFLIFIFIFSAFFIKLCDKDFFKEMKNNIFISIILIIYVIYLSIPIYAGVDKTSFYYGLFVPISTMALTLVFLYSQILSSFFSIILSIFFFIISGFNFSGFLFIFFSGICSVFTIAKVKKRTDLLIAGLYMSIINAIVVVLMYLMINKDIKIVEIILIAATNGIVSSILGIGFIAFAEFILNSPTVFRLQELSDTSSTLIKELFDSAVGTYNHSILVSNLAEAAAAEIGANAMLAKVGGLYHDIGKIETPEYFIENQGEINIHNQIKPSMSATVIKAHVKKGVELAKNNRLPEKVIDIINQHHGNGLIKYFFDQALKSNDANKGEIKEDVYRYAGEKPQFVEAAIVMLSDQVEAASRVLKKTSVSSVEKMIETIIDERFQEGILDDSGLTLKDLTKIKKVFVKLIVGMYHSRIEYPTKEDKDKDKDKDKKEGEDNKTND